MPGRFVPNEYITGQAKFLDREFIISPAVLIPRIETEEIIRMVSSSLSEPKSLIADVGTGSGCLGITLAEKYPQSTVYLSDISDKALAVARKNIRTNNVSVLKSDLLTSYPLHLRFDVIVANLPYIPSQRIPHLPASVKNYEPHLALDGGEKGVKIINRLIAELPGHVKKSSLIILEIDDTHSPKDFLDLPGFTKKIRKDAFGRNRFLIFCPD